MQVSQTDQAVECSNLQALQVVVGQLQSHDRFQTFEGVHSDFMQAQILQVEHHQMFEMRKWTTAYGFDAKTLQGEDEKMETQYFKLSKCLKTQIFQNKVSDGIRGNFETFHLNIAERLEQLRQIVRHLVLFEPSQIENEIEAKVWRSYL